MFGIFQHTISRGDSPRGHKAGPLTVLLTCTRCVCQATPGVVKGVALQGLQSYLYIDLLSAASEVVADDVGFYSLLSGLLVLPFLDVHHRLSFPFFASSQLLPRLSDKTQVCCNLLRLASDLLGIQPHKRN